MTELASQRAFVDFMSVVFAMTHCVSLYDLKAHVGKRRLSKVSASFNRHVSTILRSPITAEGIKDLEKWIQLGIRNSRPRGAFCIDGRTAEK